MLTPVTDTFIIASLAGGGVLGFFLGYLIPWYRHYWTNRHELRTHMGR